MARRAPKTGTFPKWKVTDHRGVVHVTINREFGASLDNLWNGGSPTKRVELLSDPNGYNELEISEINVAGDDRQGSLLTPEGL